MSKLTDLATEYLNRLQGLNLYKPNNIYELESAALNNTISTIVSAVQGSSMDFSNTVLGRVLLPNTPLQQVANLQLAKALAIRVAGNLRTEVLPTINLRGGVSLQKANYWDISNKDKKNFSTLVQLLVGYTKDSNPIPFIGDDFSPEQSNAFLKENRGEGQKEAYSDNISKNIYSPDDTEQQYGNDWISRDRIKKGSDVNSILSKTNEILGNHTLQNGYPNECDETSSGTTLNPEALAYSNKSDLSDPDKHIEDGYGSNQLISRGDGTYTDDSKSKFLRVFNKSNPYGSTATLMKFKHGNAGINSVLQTVFPNIAPIREETPVKNLMFSIENLAYRDSNFELPPYEIGSNGGRVMWFPPYGLSIYENISTNWQTVDFIGRTEPIYTYNGRERSISINFMLIVDYPSELSNLEWRKKSNNEFDKYFRQDNGLRKKYSIGDVNKIELARLEQTEAPKTIVTNKRTSPFPLNNALSTHFDNDKWGITTELTQDTTSGVGQKAVDDFYNRMDELVEFLNSEEGKYFKLRIAGFASKLASDKYNKVLSFFRAKSVYDYIFPKLKDVNSFKLDDYFYEKPKGATLPKTGQYMNDKFEISIHGSEKAVNKNSTKFTINQDVIDRKVMVWLEANEKLDKTLITAKEDEDERSRRLESMRLKEANLITENMRGGDYMYFERFKNDDNIQLLIQKYSDRLKYFSPVFHSQTPEDFNTRLTFLQQCTVQGKSLATDVPNSIFGKPPVCVLRLGDFFHTQIIITNVNFVYEPLVWDMNPEGIGMQPMICEVSLECKVIGGQSLQAPLIKLQNALDYNFYANTEVYKKEAKDSAVKAMEKDQTSMRPVAEPKKVSSQEARMDEVSKDKSEIKLGEVSTKDKTINYSTKIDSTIEYLRILTNYLEIVATTEGWNKYINSGQVDINSYNSWFNNLTPEEQEVEKENYGKLNTYNVHILNSQRDFKSIFTGLEQVALSGKDGSNTLKTGTELNTFKTMVNMIKSFNNDVVMDFINKRHTVTSELRKLDKYNAGTVKSIPLN